MGGVKFNKKSLFCTILLYSYASADSIDHQTLCGSCKFASNEAIYTRCIQPGTIALTFDDGPVPETTNHLLDLLKLHNISATFFINGKNYSPTLDQPETIATVLRAANEGHTVAHHTLTHKSLIIQSNDSIIYEMESLSEKIEQILGKRPSLMRPPYGYFNQTVIDIVHGHLGYRIILWSLCPCDWARDIEYSFNVYKKTLGQSDPKTTNGFIALHHDTLPLNFELTERVIDYVHSVGFRFVSLNECLGI